MNYWRVYIVMVKPDGSKNYEPFIGTCGHVVAHETRQAARNCLAIVKQTYPKAYVQKVGAIS